MTRKGVIDTVSALAANVHVGTYLWGVFTVVSKPELFTGMLVDERYAYTDAILGIVLLMLVVWAWPIGMFLFGMTHMEQNGWRPDIAVFSIVAMALLFVCYMQWRKSKDTWWEIWPNLMGIPLRLGRVGRIASLPAGLDLTQFSTSDVSAEVDGTEESRSVFEELVSDPFDRLIGVDEAVGEIKDVMELPLRHAQEMKEYKLELPKAIMLYGPPGTGKTSIARATAEHYNCGFTVVNASSMVDKYVGGSEGNIRRVFEEARANKPHVIFFDEIDAIAQRRDGQHMNRPSDILINVLLTELDGFDNLANRGVFIIAATNRLDILDPAILRPGRFDRSILVGLPDEVAREKLWKLYLKGRPLSPDLDFSELAKRTEGFSPADISGKCNAAAKNALKRHITGGQPLITTEDLL